MYSSSTKFPTICPLQVKNQCCLKQNATDSFNLLNNYLKNGAHYTDCILQIFPQKYFRKKAKLAVRGTINHPLIGIFEEKTHDVIDMTDCVLHDLPIQNAIMGIKEAIQHFKIEPYHEKTHTGVLRYLQLLTNELGELQIVLVVTRNIDNADEIEAFLSKKLLLKSFWINIQNLKTNTIFGREWIHVAKDPYLKICTPSHCFLFHPGAFCQNNLIAFSKILSDIRQHLPKQKKMLDLYSGLGLLGLSLHDLAQEIVFAETNPYSFVSYNQTILTFPKIQSQFFVDDAKNVLKKHLDADCVIVDPPRKGLEKEIKPLLSHLHKQGFLVYISCGYESLIRDLRELFDFGFKLEFAKCYDLFPGSKELEVLCILKKLN